MTTSRVSPRPRRGPRLFDRRRARNLQFYYLTLAHCTDVRHSAAVSLDNARSTRARAQRLRNEKERRKSSLSSSSIINHNHHQLNHSTFTFAFVRSTLPNNGLTTVSQIHLKRPRITSALNILLFLIPSPMTHTDSRLLASLARIRQTST